MFIGDIRILQTIHSPLSWGKFQLSESNGKNVSLLPSVRNFAEATGMVVRLHISALAISAICVGNISYLRWRFQLSALVFSDIWVDNVGYMRDLYRIHLAEKGKKSEQKIKG